MVLDNDFVLDLVHFSNDVLEVEVRPVVFIQFLGLSTVPVPDKIFQRGSLLRLSTQSIRILVLLWITFDNPRLADSVVGTAVVCLVADGCDALVLVCQIIGDASTSFFFVVGLLGNEFCVWMVEAVLKDVLPASDV